MKKFARTIALVIAAVMVFGMTVIAADSTSTTTTDANQQLANRIAQDNIDMNYTASGAKFDGIKPDWLARARKYAADHGLGEIYTVSNIVHDGPATVSFQSKYADANGAYYMLHYVGADWQNDAAYNPESWVVVPVTNNNGTLTFTSDSFSPFALGKGAAAAVVSPKTGEVMAISAILAMIMIAGAVVCAKKARLQK